MNKLFLLTLVPLLVLGFQPGYPDYHPTVNTSNQLDTFEISFNTIVSVNAEPPGDRLCVTLTRKVCDTCFTAGVYNRWGNLVWKGTDARACWSGKLMNTDSIVSAGVYFVIIDAWYNNKKHRKQGSVTFLK